MHGLGAFWNDRDPCCGDGSIAIELERAGYSVTANDLVDRSYGTPRVDFLMEWRRFDNIVMNPPFKLGQEFVGHALALADRKVASLGRLAFLEGIKRKAWLESSLLVRVWGFSRRVRIWRGGGKPKDGSMIAFAWFVWEKGQPYRPIIGLLDHEKFR